MKEGSHMKPIDLVIFDLDGTITDPAEGIVNSIARALFAMNRPMISEEICCRFIGPALMDSFTRYCNMTPDEARQAIALFREYYGETGMFECYVFDGIEALFRRLKAAGKRLAVATAKAEPFARKLLAHYGIDKYFDCIAAASLDNAHNDKAAIIEYALSSLGITDRETVIMVGDREFDITGAHDAGMRAIGVLYGYGTREEFERAGADFLAETPEEVGDLILGHSHHAAGAYTYRKRTPLVHSYGLNIPHGEPLLQAGMDGIMGESWENEQGAVVATGFFTYLLGEPTPGHELDLILREACPFGIVPKSDAWRSYLQKIGAGSYTRFKMTPPEQPDMQRLAALASSLPAGITLRPIDRSLHSRGLVTDADLNIGHAFQRFDDFLERGFGFAALDGDKTAALVSSYLVYNGEAEVDISTNPDYRRKGLATALCALFLLACAERHLAPSWDAQNPESVGLAEKLGFTLDHSYEIFTLPRE